MIHIIAAMDPRGVIGHQGEIPWNIVEEMDVFKQHTIHQSVIMGEKTFRTCVKQPLPERHNIVLSEQELEIEGVDVCNSMAKAIEKAQSYGKEIFIIGGAQVYEQALDIADGMYLSYIKKKYEGDAHFPKFDETDWQKISERDYDEFTFVTYKRK